MKKVFLLALFFLIFSCDKYKLEKKISNDIINSNFEDIDAVFEKNRPVTSFYIDSIIGNNKPSYYFYNAKHIFNANYFLEKVNSDFSKKGKIIYLSYSSNNNNVLFEYFIDSGNHLKLRYITITSKPAAQRVLDKN